MTVRLELAGSLFTFGDIGCDRASSCLSCPFPECRYDDPLRQMRVKIASRADQITEMRQTGMRDRDITRRLNISQRTLFRTMQRRALAFP